MENKQTPSRKFVCFRRWTRRGYAVFNSLKQHIRIGVLSLSCSILVLPGHSQEQPDSSRTDKTNREIDLGEVVVSAQRTPTVQSQLMRTVQVITKAEIEQSPATGLAGLLEHVSGVDIRQRGAFGMQADISIRGGTFDQTLILLNGVNLTDPQTGHHNLNLPVDLSAIQRIEVLQGPGARIFGPNAFNGAINIITREPGEKSLAVTLAGGEYGFARASVNASFEAGKTAHFLSVDGNRSDGYIPNTDFENLNLYYQSRLSLLKIPLSFQTGYTVRAFGANSFYTPRYPNQFEETKSGFFSLSSEITGKTTFRPLIYWRRHHDRFELFRDDAPEWYTTHNYHMTDVAGASANWLRTSSRFRSSLGLDYRYEHIFSNVLGNELAVPVAVPGESGIFFTRSYQRQHLSLMAEQAVYAGRLSLSGGLLAHLNNSLPQGISLYPGLDAGWQVSQHLRWVASVNRTLRLPTFTDLFYAGPTNLGNPDLKPEEAISLETGLKINKGRVNAELLTYRRWGRNMIDWAKFPGDEKWRSLNLTRVNITGAEAGFNLSFGGTGLNKFLSNVSIHYTWLQADKESEGFTSLYVLDHLRHKLDAGFSHRFSTRSGLIWKLSWQDRAGGYQPFADGSFSEEIPYKPVIQLDVKAHYDFRKIQLFAEATNLTDARILDHANVPQAGRWVMGGVKLVL